MNLSGAIERYVAWKHTNGQAFERGEGTLLSFSRAVGDVQLSQIKPDDILGFLNRNVVSTITWRLKYWILYRFFEHWLNRGVMSELMMPTPKPFVRQTFVPHIFSRFELRSLLNATAQHNKSLMRLDQSTLRTIILFLYGTGASVGEAIRILRADVDIEGNRIWIRSTRPSRARLLPIGPDLSKAIKAYLSSRSPGCNQNQNLFTTKAGLQISGDRVTKTFRRLRKNAGICRRDGSRLQPRIDDLRYTFAVHRITAWIENGADLNRMLPALAAYMGQVGLGSTGRYLFMTPERFRKNLDQLSPMHGKGRWRDDRELMQFLSNL